MIKGLVGQVNKSFIDPQLKLHFDYIDAELGKRQWFAGDDITGADIQMSFPIEAAAARGGGSWPNLKAYLERIHARPAYQRALEKGGKYELLS